MGKKSKNKKNKPSKAEKRFQRTLYKEPSEKDIEKMEEHYGTLISTYWQFFLMSFKAENSEEVNEELNDKEKELSFFDRTVYMAEEAWNLSVLSNSLEDACDTIYETHDVDEAEIITAMIKFKREHYPEDKILFRNSMGERSEDGKLTYKYKLDYTVIDDELDEQENADELAWKKFLDQDAIAKALEGVPEEHQQYAYNAEVKRQIDAMRKRIDEMLAEEKSDAPSGKS